MFIDRFWYSKNFLAYCLAPLSGCYRFVTFLRYFLYRAGFKKIYYFPVPIIVVGNITIGGTGKTPLVIWLANFLKTQGYRPGIVSRGYGSKADDYPRFVTNNSDPHQVGDEPLLVARRTSCPVVIDPNRPRAVTALLKQTDCNIILSDDGLQHYAMDRDIEIAVIDGERRFGNGFCLPVGPLREPISRLKKVDFVVSNETNRWRHSSHGWLESRSMDENNPEILFVPNKMQYSMKFISENFVRLNPSSLKGARNISIDPSPLVGEGGRRSGEGFNFHGKKIHAIAGIGNPNRFFNLLRSMHLTFTEHVFPDHHNYKPKDLKFDSDNIILMTEKDAVKCAYFADERFWYLPITAELPNEFGAKLVASVKRSETEEEKL